MSPKEEATIHDRLTEVLVQGAEIKGEMKGVNKRLDEYSRPCPEITAHIKEYEEKKISRSKFWDGIQSGVIKFVLISILIVVTGAMLFALKNGWTP